MRASAAISAYLCGALNRDRYEASCVALLTASVTAALPKPRGTFHSPLVAQRRVDPSANSMRFPDAPTATRSGAKVTSPGASRSTARAGRSCVDSRGAWCGGSASAGVRCRELRGCTAQGLRFRDRDAEFSRHPLSREGERAGSLGDGDHRGSHGRQQLATQCGGVGQYETVCRLEQEWIADGRFGIGRLSSTRDQPNPVILAAPVASRRSS